MDGVDVWDVETGRHVRAFGQEAGEGRHFVGHYLVNGGRFLFRRSPGRGTCELVEPMSGEVLARGVAPPERVVDVVWHAGRVTVLFAEEDADAAGGREVKEFGLWRPFGAGAVNPVRWFPVRRSSGARLAPDGRAVVVWGVLAVNDGGFGGAPDGAENRAATLYDAESGRLVATLERRNGRMAPEFSADGSVLVTLAGDVAGGAPVARGAGPGGPWTPLVIERHAVRTGERLSSFAPPARFSRAVPFGGDAQRALMIGQLGGAALPQVDGVADLAGGGLSASGRGVWSPMTAAFGDGRRMAVAAAAPRWWPTALEIVDARPWQPVAVLPSPAGRPAGLRVSPDGRVLGISEGDGTVRTYRRVAWECRESHLGILGMPHVWLLILLIVGLALSLRRDALGARAGVWEGRVAVLSLVMLVAALPRAVQFVLTACAGEWLWTPAPLVVIAAVGVAAGGRFWRFATIAVLAGVLSVNLWVLFELRRGGLGGTWALGVVDRVYEVPRVPVFAGVAVLAAGAVAGVWVLARRGRVVG
jgi:hypothetical protein